MPQQLLLAIGDSSLTAYRWRSGLLNLERKFAPDEEGRGLWDEYVRRNRQAVFSVFAALAEESLQTEDIPYARGADRRALVERKLAQRYPGSAWTFTRSLGRNKSGRRDEKILLAALTRPEAIAPWLAPLQRAEARLAGIYTTPLLAEALATEIGGSQACFLLISLLDGGLQQMFFDHGHLRFSRVVATNTADLAAAGEVCAGESAKLWRYLVAQRLLGADRPLPVVILLHPRDLPLFQASCRDHDALRYRFADVLAVSQKRGLRTVPQDSRSDSLFLHLMVRRTTAAQYAPSGLRRFYHLGRIQTLLRATTAAIILAGLSSAGHDLAEYSRLGDEQAPLAARITAARRNYQVAVANTPTGQFDAGGLQAVAERIDALQQEEIRLPQTLAQISAALDQTQGVELERLDWGQDREQATQDQGQSIAIHGGLPLLRGDDVAAQAAAVTGFAAALRSATGLAVDTLQWPAAIDAKRALSHGDFDRIVGERPRFILRLAVAPR